MEGCRPVGWWWLLKVSQRPYHLAIGITYHEFKGRISRVTGGSHMETPENCLSVLLLLLGQVPSRILANELVKGCRVTTEDICM